MKNNTFRTSAFTTVYNNTCGSIEFNIKLCQVGLFERTHSNACWLCIVVNAEGFVGTIAGTLSLWWIQFIVDR